MKPFRITNLMSEANRMIRNYAVDAWNNGETSKGAIQANYPELTARERAMLRQWIEHGKPLTFDD